MVNIEQTIKSKYENIANLPSLIQFPFFKFVKTILHENDINNFLEKNQNLGPYEFIENTLEYFNFKYKVVKQQIENIPKSGRVVIVANHPLGSLDALSLIDLVKSVRKDIKVVANSVLSAIEPLKPILIDVDVFSNSISKESTKEIYEALNSDKAVIIFPSGEVSRAKVNGIKDSKWSKGFIKFAKKSQSPILPIYIKAKNSSLFYTISSINKSLSTLFLVSEMFKQKGKSLEFKIGEIIPYSSYASINVDDTTLVKLFKKHLYKVAKDKEKLIFKTQKSIAHPEDRQLIKQELKEAKLLGKTTDNKEIYLFEAKAGSYLLKEIGRLREFTFRIVEEGTNKKRDIDEYDIYYKHIVLWDNENLEVVGSYRIGESNFIYPNLGADGFYSNTLFKFNKSFKKEYLVNSIELGRSFVQPKYWGSRALDYLWQGIGAYLYQNPNIRYMFGPVSLSSALPKGAQNLIVYYYNKYYGGLENFVTPKEPFILTKDEIDELEKTFTLNDKIKEFRVLREQLSYFNATIPTLYKQYTELCEDGGIKFLGFNIDHDFNDCIDGFILVDIKKIKPQKAKRYIKGM